MQKREVDLQVWIKLKSLSSILFLPNNLGVASMGEALSFVIRTNS